MTTKQILQNKSQDINHITKLLIDLMTDKRQKIEGF